MKKKHTRDELFNAGCETCHDRAHSLDQSFTFIDLSYLEEVARIKIETKVCLRCGPILIFEVPEELAEYLEEALVMAGYNLNDDTLEIQRIK